MAIEDQQPIYVLVRGLLGAYMPGHFKKVLMSLRQLGASCQLAPTLAAGTIAQNAQRIASKLPNQMKPCDRLIFLAHSKGGLETLTALNLNSKLRSQTQAAILFQTPKRGAPYLKSLFQQNIPKSPSQKLNEGFHKYALTALFAKAACQELATDEILPGVTAIEKSRFDFPVFSYSTFSTKNSGWIELQSDRINQLKPGKRNDGVFLTDDQVWPQFTHRELSEIDHAEPTVGSPRVDEAKLWRGLLTENGLLQPSGQS